MLDLYTDYRLSSFGATTAMGLARLVPELSHDQITRFLSHEVLSNKDFWHLVKAHVRSVQSNDRVLIIDDTVQEKPYSDESELISWHYDHSVGRTAKGINLLSALYFSQDSSIPVAFELIQKPQLESNAQTISGCIHAGCANRFPCPMYWPIVGSPVPRICALSSKKPTPTSSSRSRASAKSPFAPRIKPKAAGKVCPHWTSKPIPVGRCIWNACRFWCVFRVTCSSTSRDIRDIQASCFYFRVMKTCRGRPCSRSTTNGGKSSNITNRSSKMPL